MKKILATVLALCLLCSLAAMASAAGTFRVGVKDDLAGFSLRDPLTGKFEGFEVDLANKLAEALGYDDVELTPVIAATRGQLLDSGDLDAVIATFTINDTRKEQWDFSTPYYTDIVTVLVKTESGITTLADLNGKTIGVSSSSTSALSLCREMVAQGLISEFDEATFIPSTFNGSVSFAEYGAYPDISDAMDAGVIDAFCVDKSILSNYKYADRSYIQDEFAPQDYGVATAKGSELSAQIDALIVQWLDDGTINAMKATWGI